MPVSIKRREQVLSYMCEEKSRLAETIQKHRQVGVDWTSVIEAAIPADELEILRKYVDDRTLRQWAVVCDYYNTLPKVAPPTDKIAGQYTKAYETIIRATDEADLMKGLDEIKAMTKLGEDYIKSLLAI